MSESTNESQSQQARTNSTDNHVTTSRNVSKDSFNYKKDEVDIIGSAREIFNRDSIASYIASAAILIPSFQSGEPRNLPLALASLAIPAMIHLPRMWVNADSESVRTWSDSKDKTPGRVMDSELGYSATPLIYRGEETLQTGETELDKGNSYLFVQLPHIPTESALNPGIINPLRDLQSYAVEEITDATKDLKFDTVCIYVPTEQQPSGTKTHTKVSKEVLFSKKDITLTENPGEVVMLSRESFTSLATAPSELFTHAIEKLGDKRLSELIELAKSATTPDERSGFHELLNKQLQTILQTEFDKDSSATVRWSRDETTNAPQRIRTHESVRAQLDRAGIFRGLLLSDMDGVYGINLETHTRLQASNIEELLEDDRPLTSEKRAQITLLLNKMLSEEDFSDLIRKRMDRHEAITALRDAGASLQLSEYPDGIDVAKTKRKRFRDIKKTITPFILPFVLTAGLHAGASGIEVAKNVISSGNGITLGDGESPTVKPSMDGVPTRSLDWKLETHGEIMPNGYYVTDTSHEVAEDGSWLINTDIAEQIFLPVELPSEYEKSYINLSKRIRTRPVGDTKIKIPIENSSGLEALQVVDPDGKVVAFSTYQLTDGTVELVIPGSLSGYVDVKAQLVQETTDVHAAEKVESIDEELLLPDIRKKLSEIRETAQDDVKYADYKVFQNVEDSHHYSVNPAEAEALKNAITPEDLVNVISEMVACDCDVCNTQAVLSTTLHDTETEFTNMAFGYLNGTLGAGSSDMTNYLRGETRHGFAIDNLGSVFDATPTNIVMDDVTTEYMELLKGTEGGMSADTLWDEQLQDLSDTSDLLHKLQISGALLALLAGVKLARPTVEQVRKITDKKRLRKLADTMLTSVYSEEEMRTAYKFFSALSWSGRDKLSQEDLRGITDIASDWTESQYRNKQELLQGLFHNTSGAALKSYDEDAQSYDEELSLSAMEKAKLRMLARYLRNPVLA